MEIYNAGTTILQPLTCDALIIPYSMQMTQTSVLPPSVQSVSDIIKAKELFSGKSGEIYTATVCENDAIVSLIFLGLGEEKDTLKNRKTFLNFGKALKKAKDLGAKSTLIYLDNAPIVEENHALCVKLCELPYSVSYTFSHYKPKTEKPAMEKVHFVTKIEASLFEKIMEEGKILGESATLARDLSNFPSDYMKPSKLAEEATAMAKENGIDVQVFDKPEIEKLGMHTFLAVARGAVSEPKLIVLRYMGGKETDPIIGLVGKGIMFDSGGYSLKSTMADMHDDMSGGSAVIGAMRALAQNKVAANVVAVVAACENRISGEAYVPGDILYSMSGKTIEMLNADAEGRLTLADAVTYIIQKENAAKIIDIATLTGAVKTAVGNKTAGVISNDDTVWNAIWDASQQSCEKVWRLDNDEELQCALDSPIADIRNIDPSGSVGGGAITGGLFIQAFVEDKPWAHIDIGAVTWNTGKNHLFTGATGYGVSLLYYTVLSLIR